MKKVFITLAVIIAVLIGALFAIPYFFKGDVLRIIQKQAEKQVNADVTIGDIELSMFRSFPNLNVSVKDVSVTGKEVFANDTLVYLPIFEASVNLKSFISGNEIIINRILLKDARFAPLVTAEGKANWDILMAGDTTAQNTGNQESKPKKEKEEKNFRFNDIAIEHLGVVYRDNQNSTEATIRDINLDLSGNFSESNTLIKIALDLNDISYRQENSLWIDQSDIKWAAEIEANLKDQVFELKESNFSVNDLQLNLAGKIAMLGDKSQVDLKLNAPDTKFESLLALVPKNFRHYLDGLQTTGDFILDITANGEVYPDHLPAIDARLVVKDANVQYTGLPEAIRKINIDLNVTNPGGSVDSTKLNLKHIGFDIAGNPFNMFLQIANLNDPSLKGGANGVINFSNLKKALPLKDITLAGVITTDITFDGKYQYIEKEQYEKFIAKGNITLENILFKNADFPEGISIPQGSIAVTPATLNLNNLQAKINSSDFTLKGSISNYLPYLFKNDVLKGNFSLASNLVNLNEFMMPPAPATKASPTATTATPTATGNTVTTGTPAPGGKTATGTALEIPKNINIQFTTNINTILFDKLTIKNVAGNVSLANAVATLKNLKMNMLNGTMVMNGHYNAINPQIPTVDFSVNVSGFDINAAFNSFSFIRQSLPIAVNCQGQVSSDMKFRANMDQDMNVVMNSVNGGGFVESKGVLINDNPAMEQLANVLKNDELSRLSISYLKINFKLENGNIVVEPFTTSLAGNPATIYGQQTVEGQLDYTVSVDVNRKYFGKEINNLLQAIPGSNNIESLEIDVKLGGTVAKPTIKPNLTKAMNTIKKEAEKELKNKAKEGIINGLEKLFKKH